VAGRERLLVLDILERYVRELDAQVRIVRETGQQCIAGSGHPSYSEEGSARLETACASRRRARSPNCEGTPDRARE